MRAKRYWKKKKEKKSIEDEIQSKRRSGGKGKKESEPLTGFLSSILAVRLR